MPLKFTIPGYGEYDLSGLKFPFSVKHSRDEEIFKEVEWISDYLLDRENTGRYLRSNSIPIEETYLIFINSENQRTFLSDVPSKINYTSEEFIQLVKTKNKNNEILRKNQTGESGSEGKGYVKQTIQVASGIRPVGSRISNMRSRTRARAIEISGRRIQFDSNCGENSADY